MVIEPKSQWKFPPNWAPVSHLPPLPSSLFSCQTKVKSVPSVVENQHQTTSWVKFRVVFWFIKCFNFSNHFTSFSFLRKPHIWLRARWFLCFLLCKVKFGWKTYKYQLCCKPGLSFATALIPANMEAAKLANKSYFLADYVWWQTWLNKNRRSNRNQPVGGEANTDPATPPVNIPSPEERKQFSTHINGLEIKISHVNI